MRARAASLVAGIVAGAAIGWALPVSADRRAGVEVAARCSSPFEQRRGGQVGRVELIVGFRSAVPADDDREGGIRFAAAVHAPPGWQVLLAGAPVERAPEPLRAWSAARGGEATVLPGPAHAMPAPPTAREARVPVELTIRGPAGARIDGILVEVALLDLDGRVRAARTRLDCSSA